MPTFVQFVLTSRVKEGSRNLQKQMMTTTLKPWLQMIFGPHGDNVVQKMQEWAQNKFDALYDPSASPVAFLGPDAMLDDCEFQGTLHQGRRQGKAILVWPQIGGCKKVLHGYFHDDLLVGNLQIQHLGT